MSLRRIEDTANNVVEEIRIRPKGELSRSAWPINNTQLNIILSLLIIVAAVLAFIFLRLDYVSNYIGCFRLYIFEGTIGNGWNLDTEWGLLARDGLWGVLWGVVTPIFLCATAAFVAAGARGPLVVHGARKPDGDSEQSK